MVTVAYLCFVVYANVSEEARRLVCYGAFEYNGPFPPPIIYQEERLKIYKPEELGIVSFHKYENETHYWLHIGVDKDKEPFPLQEPVFEYEGIEGGPIFEYEGKLFYVSCLWITPGLHEELLQERLQLPVGIGIAIGWITIGGVAIHKSRVN